MGKLAIAHDWLLIARGAERVLSEFCAGRDDLSIYTLFLDPEAVGEEIRRQSVYVSGLNWLPGVRRHYRYLLPLYPRAARRLRVEGAEALISISHSVAKGIPCQEGIPHVCYCLTPMRYIWEPELYGDALQGSLRARLLGLIASRLKAWDLETSRRVDLFVSISATVRDRVKRIYGRESEVIHPCVDLDFFQPGDSPREDFFLIVSALVPQKRLEVAVEAFNRSGRRLLVAGQGPSLAELARLSRSNIEFLGWRSDREIRELYRRARALVFPGTEDFGLVPVEAQACGCPVVAYRRGGLTETVIEDETGLFFEREDAEDLNQALTVLEATDFDPQRIRRNAERFSRDRFRRSWRDLFRQMGLRIFDETGGV